MDINLKVANVIFSVSNMDEDNYRKLGDKKLSILLIKNKNWEVPTVKVESVCKIDDNIQNFVDKVTNLKNVYSEQLYTFSEVESGQLEITQTYISLINKTGLENELNENCKWFDVDLKELENMYECTLKSGNDKVLFRVSKKLKPQTTDRYAFSEIGESGLTKNNAVYIISGFERLKNKITYTDIVFNMMPKYFTLKNLQQVFEAVLNKKLLDPAFRRVIANKVVATGTYQKGKGHRPSELFTYKGK